eukprot:835696_1
MTNINEITIDRLGLCNASRAGLVATFTKIDESREGTNAKVAEVKTEVDDIQTDIGDLKDQIGQSGDASNTESLYDKLTGTKVVVDGVKQDIVELNGRIGQSG